MGDDLPDIRVPDYHKAGLLTIRDLTDDEFGALANALKQADPAEGTLVDELVHRVTEAVSRLSPRSARGMVRALLSVESARTVHGNTLAGFANSIATSETLDLSPEEAASLATRIELLTEIPAVAVTAKAMSIADEHDRVFHSARILTDIRPVFGDDATQPPVGAVVTQVLRIDAFRHGQLEDYYVALDSQGLSELQAVVRRAVEKNESLNQVLDNIGFSRFNMSEEG